MAQTITDRSCEGRELAQVGEHISGRGPNYGKLRGPFLQQIHQEYIEGSSYEKLGGKYNLAPSAIAKSFVKFGLRSRTVQESNSNFSSEHKEKLKQAARSRWNKIRPIDRYTKQIVTYGQMHARVETTRGKPPYCSICDTTDITKMYHWANLTGKYEDPSDYTRMCASCHRKFDAMRRREIKQQTGTYPKSVRPNWEEKYG